jgi:hypothetical protein
MFYMGIVKSADFERRGGATRPTLQKKRNPKKRAVTQPNSHTGIRVNGIRYADTERTGPFETIVKGSPANNGHEPQ